MFVVFTTGGLRGLEAYYVWLLGLQQPPRIHRTRRALLFLAATVILENSLPLLYSCYGRLSAAQAVQEGLAVRGHFLRSLHDCILVCPGLVHHLDCPAHDRSRVELGEPLCLEQNLYDWTINSYLLASTAVQPLFGQAANIFGRRSRTLLSVVLFLLGSGIAGGASSKAMMIGGRTVQGIGGGGINNMVDIVVCDLVSLRERGKYVGLIGSMWAIGSVVDPLLGGAFAQYASWRWIFYINLPLSGVALALLVPFLRLRYKREGNLLDRLRREDYLGNAVLILAVVAILLALTWGGTVHAWSSWRTIVPLVLGFVGVIGFLLYEATPAVKEPTMPMRLFTNRTSSTSFLLTFLHGILLYWACYFLPVYFQAVLNASPTRSGIMLFPIATTTAPFGVVAGILITATGHYRVFHFAGSALMAIACGLFTLLDASSSTGSWVGLQILFGTGAGFIFTSTLSAILAALTESEVATATATWAFLRSFGSMWGTAIPSAVFNSRVNQLLYTVRTRGLEHG